jgi:tetratricopeptide (TPR) repeat protein
MSTLGAVVNLGILYPNQGRPAKAEVIHQRALAGFEKVLGPEHTSTLLAAGNLGDLYSKLGNLVKAEAMYQRAQGGFEKTLGSDHPLTLWACNQLDILQGTAGLAEAQQFR